LVQHYIQNSVLQEQGQEFFFFEDFEISLYSYWDYFQTLKFWMFLNALSFFQIEKNRKFGFFLSEKLDPKNPYEPHVDTNYKSLLF